MSDIDNLYKWIHLLIFIDIVRKRNPMILEIRLFDLDFRLGPYDFFQIPSSLQKISEWTICC